MHIGLSSVARARRLKAMWAQIVIGVHIIFALSLFGNPSRLFAATVDSNCQAMLDAQDKLLKVPYHAFATSSGSTGGPTIKVEMIYVDGSLYNEMLGTWTIDESGVESMKEMEENSKKRLGNVSCQHLRDEPMYGELAGVFSNQNVSDAAIINMTMWISKSSGRIIRIDSDTTLKKNKYNNKMSIRYEYNNVKKPMM